jgi:raffinose/stachyose/melibiose transport system substrate-binding protein
LSRALQRGGLALALVAILAACGSSAIPSAVPASETPASAGPATEAPEAEAPAVTLTYLVDDTEATRTLAQALADAYTVKHPNVTIEIETRPGGSEGDNLVKTRLATGDMTDIFFYNSGSLLQALSPTKTLVDLSGESFQANIADIFKPTVSQGGGMFGVPTGTATGGGVLYNKKIFADLGLSVPKSWAAFAANNDTIKAAGIAPVGATFGDTWTSQLFVLADYYNTWKADPEWATKYTANDPTAKYVTDPALKGFQRLEEGFNKGWWQEDFGTDKFDEGLAMLAEGTIAQYPMLTFALPTIATNYPEAVQDIGFFGQPGDDAASNGATLWMPAGTYIANTSTNIDVAKDFLGFIASVEGTEVMTAAQPPSGPYVINGSSLPADALPAVLDIQAYIDSSASTAALEFSSPIKGPQLEQITVEVGSGLRSAADGAALYDQDVAKQGKQLGLPGW